MVTRKFILDFFLKIYDRLTSGNYNMLEYDLPLLKEVTKQNTKYSQHINGICRKSDIYRSIAQYNCQTKLLSLRKRLVINLLSIIVLTIILPIFVLGSVMIIFNRKLENHKGGKTAVLSERINVDLVPMEILEKYNVISEKHTKLSIDYHLFEFFIGSPLIFILRPYFALKVLFKLSKYSAIVKKYNPSAILTFTEYSFTSSILTSYLERFKIKHIYFMDGEKLLDIKSSFFRFSESWVWDEHYIQLFTKMMAVKEQFIVGSPLIHNKLKALKVNSITRTLLKYYWGPDIRKEFLEYVLIHLKRLKDLGLLIIVRGHPRHMRVFNKYVKPVFSDFIIESPEEKSFMDSFIESDIIISSYSTTLYEAVLAGKAPVIIDYNKDLEKLETFNYKLVKDKKVIPLSTFMHNTYQ